MTPIARRHAGWLLALALAAAAPGAAAYDCMAAHGGLDRASNDAAERDAKATIARLQAALAAPVAPGRNRRARLDAELANAAIVGDQPGLSRAAATAGLAAIEDPAERPLVDALSMLEAFAISELGDRRRALELYTRIAARVPDSAAYRVCVLDELAYLYYRNDEIGAAVSNLMRAYTLAAAPGFEADRANTADELATMFQRLDFLDEAMPLADEALAHFRTLGDERGLADALRRRGELLGRTGDIAAAERDLAEALRLARKVHDRFRELFTSVSVCVTERGAGKFAAAEVGCRDAERVAVGFENPSGQLAADLASGELALARGQPRLALTALDAVARAPQGATSNAMRRRLDLARGRTLEALGDYRGAYATAQRYIDESRAGAEAQAAARVAVLRVQFETARTERELKLATAEKRLLEQTAASDRRTRDLAIAGAALACGLAALILLSRRRRLRADAARRDAELRLDAVGRLTGAVAHDFNNLMTVVQQAVGLLAVHPSLRGDAAVQNLLSEARQAATTGGAITRQLLAFARQVDLRPETRALEADLEQWRPMLERAAGERVALTIRAAPGLPPVRVDPTQLVTALLNLVVNAVDAAPAAGTIEIAVGPARPADPPLPGGVPAVRIDVADNGRGMPAEVLAHAVEPFFSTKAAGHGSGLGLSVVDGFVRQSGGRLAIDSAPGRGTVVTLWLPAAPPVPAAAG